MLQNVFKTTNCIENLVKVMDIIFTFKGKDMAKAFGPVQIVGHLMT
jgi:hypothetical protein